ncbi:VanZ family protein [Oceanobacillus senegalensis]|uniref:VanZ family protein n=1 Tax=Oceanobacillus senegalensis TaxID=1936063 RepID=UPI000A313026|nr:VanZ family protein [Oceanobacillus senegalensis]
MILDVELMFGADKQMHLWFYFMISFMVGFVVVLLSSQPSIKKRIRLTWMFLVTIGTLEEYRQLLIPNRSAEVLDAIANMIGVTFGLAIPIIVLYVMKYRKYVLRMACSPYVIILFSLFMGLVLLNERPFVALDGSIQEKWRSLVAVFGK